MSEVVLRAPFAGWLCPLEEVPDPVFAERMMGDGVAIDPLEAIVRAPCDAEVLSLPDTRHAVTLRLDNGAELLIHVGLETVDLKGDGFTAHVSDGGRVAAGDPLISFDLGELARKARSLVTPIVIANEGYGFAGAAGRRVGSGDPIGTVVRTGGAASQAAGDGETCTGEFAVGSANGLHARPAARIAAAAKVFASSIEVSAKGATASAKSPIALMKLGLRRGDRVKLTAQGPDSSAAFATLSDLIQSNLDQGQQLTSAARAAAPRRSEEPGKLYGICAAPGFAVGTAAHFAFEWIDVREQGLGVEQEREALAAARRAVATRIASYAPASGGIAVAHQGLLDDPELLAAADAEIAAGRSAAFAWRAALDSNIAMLRATANDLLIERVDDLEDIKRQVLAELAGEAEFTPRPFPDGAILIAENLLPSQLMTLDLGRVGGICTARGGPTSHVAILAASAGVPMLVAMGYDVTRVPEGAELILDASAGWLQTSPDEPSLSVARQRVEQERRAREAERAAAAEECRTADGTRIEIFANLSSAGEAASALAAGAEGCGLLRTEFLFHDRPNAPSEDEQAEAYANVAKALGGRPLIIRTLDAGGDKPVPYLAIPPQDNPALGLRGVRLSLYRPELLRTQLRAILRSSAAGDIRVMIPMVIDSSEIRAVRSVLVEEAESLGIAPVPLGIMVETPAAALLADSLSAEADFLSVGTNDLTQYALAADRGNAATADRLDPLHPAVLRLIAAAGEGARRHSRQLGICGGAASDPLAAAILIGLGATELSATPASIPALKAAVRRLSMEECRSLADEALRADSPATVRRLASDSLNGGKE